VAAKALPAPKVSSSALFLLLKAPLQTRTPPFCWFVSSTPAASSTCESFYVRHALLPPPVITIFFVSSLSFPLRHAAACSKQLKLMITDHKAEDLVEIASLLEKSNAKPRICEVFPFTAQGVEDGFKLLESRRAKGKIIFDVGQ
jgi:hypothetical protein